MYQVYLGSNIIYHPLNDLYSIYETEWNEECGLAGEFTFKVPSTNPLYDSLVMGALVSIYKDKKEVFRGEIKDLQTDFNKVITVYCIEDLSWLGDEYLPPVSIKDETYQQRFQAAIEAYNSTRPAERQFAIGYINARVPTNTCTWVTEYEESILDSLRGHICGSDGYVRIRRVTSGSTVTRYVDIVSLENYGTAAEQPIEYGYNLLDYVKESDYGNLTNVLTPYGAELETEVYDGYAERVEGTTISNADSIAAYGRHAKSVIFENVSNVDSLNNLAQAYLTRYCQPQLTMEVKAVDLAGIENIDAINLGDSVRIIAKPFAVDQRLYLTQLIRDIQDASKNTLTLSGHVTRGRTITDQTQAVEDMIKSLPTTFSILDSAKKNALAMLLDETQGGYVVYEYDANNEYLVAINICNAKTIAKSTKRWRWSQNGFGYMKRNSTSASWTGPTVAMTMDGSIVADFINTGSLTADVIKLGTLKDVKTNGQIFLLDLVNGTLNADFEELSIGSKAVATEEYTNGAVSGAIKELDQEEIFNILTNNGEQQGIYLKDGKLYINATYMDTGTLSAGLIKAGVLTDKSGNFSLNMNTGALSMSSGSFGGSLYGATGTFSGRLNAATGTFAGELSAATGSFKGSLSAATGTFSGTLSAARGTITDGTGTLKLSSGSLYMNNSKSDGPGLFAEKDGSDLYACWGAKNSAARKDGSYQETNTINVIKAGVNASDERLKQDIEDLDAGYCKSLIFGIKPKRFSYKSHPDELELGVIAQDIAKVQEEYGITKRSWLCYKNDDDMYEVEYKQLIAPMIKVIQEQQKQIEKLMMEVENG